MSYEKASSLAPYSPEEGGCKIRLDANESAYNLPEELLLKVRQAVGSIDFNRYPDPLAEDVCAAYAKNYGVDKEFLTAGNGSDELISVLFNTFASKGSRVLMTAPDFSMYRFYCTLAECEPVIVRKDKSLSVGADELIEAAKREKPAMLIFSNPCNPTGQGISREDALRVAKQAGCLVVIDEAYMDFWDQSLLGVSPLPENLIILRTCSKIGLAAMRLGFAAAGKRLTGYLRAAKSPYNVNSMTQAAGAAVLSEPGFIKDAAKRAVLLKEALEDSLASLQNTFPGNFELIPTHTNFSVVRSENAGKFHRVLREKGISVRYFPKELLRITAGNPEENSALISAFTDILRKGTH